MLPKSVTAFIFFAKTANASNATMLDDGQIATTAIFSFFGGLAILTSGLYCCQAVRRWREELKQVQQMPNMRTAKVTPINYPSFAVASLVIVHPEQDTL